MCFLHVVSGNSFPILFRKSKSLEQLQTFCEPLLCYLSGLCVIQVCFRPTAGRFPVTALIRR